MTADVYLFVCNSKFSEWIIRKCSGNVDNDLGKFFFIPDS